MHERLKRSARMHFDSLSRSKQKHCFCAAKTLARLGRANDFAIRSAEQLKAEALLLRCEDVRALRPRERFSALFTSICSFCQILCDFC
ncbi:hypothetical protein gvb03_02990 [Gardnerella vaginalis]|nr:hypothetical protein gvb03_02990 [Gardnerella vaginalis]RDW98984.1 hypothetical protein gvb01_06050 [Gardnerella vaginalis]